MIRFELEREPPSIERYQLVRPPDVLIFSARSMAEGVGFTLSLPVPHWKGLLAQLGRQVSRDHFTERIAMDAAVGSLTMTQHHVPARLVKENRR